MLIPAAILLAYSPLILSSMLEHDKPGFLSQRQQQYEVLLGAVGPRPAISQDGGGAPLLHSDTLLPG